MIEKVIDLQIKSNADQAVGSLKSQLREAQAEVATLSDKFGATSQEAINAAKRAGELKDRIGDAKALTDAFNPDAKFKALSASLSGVAGGFAAVQGGMALFGSQSEDVEKTLLKVQSAMALSQGLQSIGESVDSFKQLGAVLKSTSVIQGIYNFVQTGSLTALKANTVATEAQTVATEVGAVATATASGGLKLFRLALIGTGIGAIVVGLGLLIANFDKVKKVIMNLIPGLASVGDFIGGIVDSVTDFVGATSDATRAVDKLKKEAETTLSVNKKFMQEHGDQVDEYTKKKIDAKNAYAEAVKEDGANQTELAKRLNRELAEIEYSRGDEKRKIQKEANEKANADKKADNEKAIELEKENQKKYAEETKTGLQILTQANLDNQAQIKLDKRNLLDEQIALLNEGVDAEQQAETKITENSKTNADARVKLSEAEAAAKQALFAKSADVLSKGADLLGKNTAAGKSMAVAAALINTYQGITTELATKTVTPFEIGLKIANVAIIAATGFKAVKDIIAVKVPGGGGGGAVPSGGAMGGAPSPPSFNIVGASGTNQIAQAIGGQQQQPVQAYVVAGAVTTGQSLNRNIIANASMG